MLIDLLLRCFHAQALGDIGQDAMGAGITGCIMADSARNHDRMAAAIGAQNIEHRAIDLPLLHKFWKAFGQCGQ